jgi:UDP-glucose 4-epimerase
MKSQTILVTGGLGYIGSHTVVELINKGFKVIILDNLSNSKKSVLNRIQKITLTEPTLYIGDVQDRNFLRKVLQKEVIDSVIHFAGLKSVSESEFNPLRYYDNNVMSSLILFEELLNFKIHKILFSSSATVYGSSEITKYTEDTPLRPINVYGKTKLMVEDILRDLYRAYPFLRIALLRYFNPVGAHPSGLIGEDPSGTPNNLMPFITQVAVGVRKKLTVYGNDYSTLDGTGLRDYIHVCDLARGHISALEALKDSSQILTLNLGTGLPISVLQMIATFEATSGVPIPYEVVGRRNGDLPKYYADPSLAWKLLGWKAELGLEDICADSWRWQKNNPLGYES